MDDIAISVKHVDKTFILPHENVNSLKGLFLGAFKNKDKSFEVQKALTDISFEVKKGEFFGIVGRNGSGKSTLLKILAGIYQPTKGSVQVNGKLVPFIELGVGFNPELSGRENVYLNGALLGFSQKQVDKKYQAIVEFAELERFMDQKLKNYSSGMQVRLAFSVATVLAESDILLIDEVLAVGDADFQRKCFKYFRSLKKLKKTIVFVTHDMNAVKEYCDRAVIINDSRITGEGSAEDIAEQYLKLFANDNEAAHGSNDSRWGNHMAKIVNEPIVKFDKSKVTISIDISASKNIHKPVVGFLLTNGAGASIIGTNNRICEYAIKNFPENSISKIEWEFDNILSSGDYSFTFSVQSDDGSIIYDWWNNAVECSVVNKQNTPYPVSPTVKILAGTK